jgi:hypothetical protein
MADTPVWPPLALGRGSERFAPHLNLVKLLSRKPKWSPQVSSTTTDPDIEVDPALKYPKHHRRRYTLKLLNTFWTWKLLSPAVDSKLQLRWSFDVISAF